MPTFEQTVYVDVDLGDLDEDELIKELEDRGFYVSEQPHDIIAVEYHWNRGDKKEALILLERKFPELIGISKLID
jgi:hypothetical protein